MHHDAADGSEQSAWAAEQRRGAAQRYRETQLPLGKLWTYHYGIGGDMDEVSLEAYLHEALDVPSSQVNLIATAMTELIEDGNSQ